MLPRDNGFAQILYGGPMRSPTLGLTMNVARRLPAGRRNVEAMDADEKGGAGWT